MHDPAAYGNDFAPVYDDLYPSAPDDALSFLAEMAAPGGRVLELGIGTGRFALPLARRGLKVHGVDASPAMVERLRAKPAGADIPVTMGDFADVSGVPGAPFDLAFVAFNTFFALLTQEAQLRCFSSVASVLAPGGRFVVEAFVPDLTRFSNPQPALLAGAFGGAVHLEASQHDLARQRVSSRFISIADGDVRVRPIEIRYAWPSELDLMARLAGLELEGRWAGWSRQAFSSASGMHVSSWRRP